MKQSAGDRICLARMYGKTTVANGLQFLLLNPEKFRNPFHGVRERNLLNGIARCAGAIACFLRALIKKQGALFGRWRCKSHFEIGNGARSVIHGALKRRRALRPLIWRAIAANGCEMAGVHCARALRSKALGILRALRYFAIVLREILIPCSCMISAILWSLWAFPLGSWATINCKCFKTSSESIVSLSVVD